MRREPIKSHMDKSQARAAQVRTDKLVEDVCNQPDSRLYRMIYIEPGKYSTAEVAAAQREMDRRAINVKVVSRYRSDRSSDKRRDSSSQGKSLFNNPANLAFYLALVGLGYIGIAVIYHWVDHKAITNHDIYQGLFRLCIAAAIYMYLVFRRKPSRK